MPKGRLEYLKRLLPFLQNQSEDCLYLNVFSPLHGKPDRFFRHHLFGFALLFTFFLNALASSGGSRKEIAGAGLHSWRIIRMEFGESLRRLRAG